MCDKVNRRCCEHRKGPLYLAVLLNLSNNSPLPSPFIHYQELQLLTYFKFFTDFLQHKLSLSSKRELKVNRTHLL